MYTVVEVFENAIMIWDGETKDDQKKPTGQMALYIGNHPYHVGDEVRLVIQRVSEVIRPELSEVLYYTNEPVGRSGLTHKLEEDLGDATDWIAHETVLPTKPVYGSHRILPEEYPHDT